MPNPGRLGFRPSKLNGRDKMNILNYKGIMTRPVARSFCKLLGREEDDYLFDLSISVLIEIREKFRSTKWAN